MSKILIATDFSETANTAFRYGLWFAKIHGAQVCLLHVVYPELELADIPVVSGQVTMQRVEAAKEVMKVLVENPVVEAESPEIEMLVEVGTPAATIAKVAEQNKVDLIIMGAKGERNILDRTIGNITASAIESANHPILVVPENTDSFRLETVAYATDLVESDPFHIWQTGKLLKAFSPIFRVIHIQRKSKEKRSVKMEDLEAFFKGYPPALQITFHNILNKKVKEEIEVFIKDWDIDLLVMNRPNRSVIERIFHSSLTKKTALYTKIPFLVMK